MLLFVVMTMVLLSSCSSEKYLGEGQLLLDHASLKCDSSGLDKGSLALYIRQHPNSRWVSSVKVPLGIYLMAGSKGNNMMQRFLRRMGEKPVIFDSVQTASSAFNIREAVRNMGYLHATVTTVEKVHGHKVNIIYNVHPGRRYYVDSICTDIRDTALVDDIEEVSGESCLKRGMPYDANILSSERSRITSHLLNKGYYRFNREFINYDVDTIYGPDNVWLRMNVLPFRTSTDTVARAHQLYRIGQVSFTYDRSSGSPIWIRDNVLFSNQSLYSGQVYRESDVQDTYLRMNRLGAVAATNVRLTESPEDSTLLDADIVLTPARLNSVQFGLDGTNTAGDLGVAAYVNYQNHNVFHGSEIFSLKVRTAFEAIRNLSGYEDQNYFEYSIETGLTFPDLRIPLLSRGLRRKAQGTSELSIDFDSQNRPEFHRRVLTGAWRYRWTMDNGRHQHRIDLVDLNYVFMPFISDTFRAKYIDNPESRNAIIAYNYQNLFILKWGYQWQFSSIGTSSPSGIYGKNAYTMRFAIETAGNLLHAICNMANTKKDSIGQRSLFGVAYAQYAKFDFDFSRSIRFSSKTSLALHCGLGVAYPYGNSTILPYEKRYFSGGANSVRGWSVRELGPGTFRGTDGKIDFINQTGDVKLDLNVEFRAHLLWKLDGAAFIDAGNIWTLRDYEDQPGGQFNWGTCWRQIAVSYGLGLRLNFNYFILRFDMGMKAINPAFDDNHNHYPIAYPNFRRDFTFHFAVGLPF